MNNTSLLGIVLLVVGLIVLGTGVAFFAPTQNTVNLVSTSRVIATGDNQAVGVTLSAGGIVTGTFSQTNGSSVNLYFMTAAQQQVFGNCVPCDSPSIVNASSQANYKFSWTINSTGTYYFVMDNSYGASNVAVSLAAQNNLGSTSSTPYYAVLSIGVVLIVLGVAVAVLGTRAKRPPPVRSG